MPTYNENFVSDIRDAFKTLLEADEYFDGIPIITERHRDIQTELATTIGVDGGLAIVLALPELGGVLANLKGAQFDRIKVVARVHENLAFAAGAKEALNVAVHIAIVANLWAPDAVTGSFALDEPGIQRVDHPNYLTYEVSLLTKGGSFMVVDRLGALTVDSSNPAAVTLTHATPGVAIFYTLDGTVPNPQNGTLYAGAVNAETFTLRARGWLAGFIPSPEIKLAL